MKYELELRRPEGSEFRLTARPLNLGDEFDSDGTRWRVAEVALPRKDLVAIVRYVCIDLRTPSTSGRLRAVSERIRRRAP